MRTFDLRLKEDFDKLSEEAEVFRQEKPAKTRLGCWFKTLEVLKKQMKEVKTFYIKIQLNIL